MSEKMLPEFTELSKSHLFSPADAAARELWARRFVTEITGVARGLGYGLFHGGSLIRDIDLVAVPWTAGKWSLSHTEFVLELHHVMGLVMGNHGETLFGHRWYALWHPTHPDHQIDMKVMLPVARPLSAAQAAELKRLAEDLENAAFHDGAALTAEMRPQLRANRNMVRALFDDKLKELSE